MCVIALKLKSATLGTLLNHYITQYRRTKFAHNVHEHAQSMHEAQCFFICSTNYCHESEVTAHFCCLTI